MSKNRRQSLGDDVVLQIQTQQSNQEDFLGESVSAEHEHEHVITTTSETVNRTLLLSNMLNMRGIPEDSSSGP